MKDKLDIGAIVDDLKCSSIVILSSRQCGKMSNYNYLMKVREEIYKSGGIPNEMLR